MTRSVYAPPPDDGDAPLFGKPKPAKPAGAWSSFEGLKPIVGHAHPVTSQEAAESVEAKLGERLQLVLDTIARPNGCTDEEGQDLIQLPGNSWRPCRRQLVLLDLIRDSGEKRPTHTGHRAIVWKLKRPA